MNLTKKILEKNQYNYSILYKLILDNKIKVIEIGVLECEWVFDNRLRLRNKNIFVNGTVFIKSLHIHPEFRKKGYGSKLLRNAIKDASSRGIYKIELDDMSDHFAKTNNIYLKNGFQYVNSLEGPEMYLITM